MRSIIISAVLLAGCAVKEQPLPDGFGYCERKLEEIATFVECRDSPRCMLTTDDINDYKYATRKLAERCP